MRKDIQGLRAVAVLAVVATHLTGHPRGGFVGVDVFFVISGFLITSHLLGDLQRTQSHGRARSLVSFLGDFYRRRIRRLLPAAALVVLATVVATHFLLPARSHATWHDGVWASFFAANWHFASVGTDYFTANGPTSPLQHFWSLSVEEQFYLVWPLALFALAWLAKARGPSAARRMRHVGGWLAAVLAAASLAWAFHESAGDAVTAYFSTTARAWELGFGAVLACAQSRLRLPSRLATGLSCLGVAVICWSLFAAHGGSGFPAPGAIAPCLGAALVLGAIPSAGNGARNPLLTNPVSTFIGDISYSLYLVHFPVFILLASRMPHAGGYFYVAAILLSFGLAIALFALVERPILRSHWLVPVTERSAPRQRKRLGPVAIAGLATTVIGLGVCWVWPGDAGVVARKQAAIARAVHAIPSSSASSSTRSGAAGSPRATVKPTPQLDALQHRIRVALLAKHWPALRPSISSVVNSPESLPAIDHCAAPTLKPVSSCSFGAAHARHTIELIGDSNAVTWAAGLERVVSSEPGWRLRVAAGFACDFADQVLVGKGAGGALGDIAAHCAQRNADVVAEIKATRPDVVVLTNIATEPHNVASIENELRKVAGFAGKLVIFGQMPGAADPRECATPGSTPSACVSTVPARYQTVAIEDNRRIAAAVGATFVDTTDWTCAQAYCPGFVGSTPTRYDADHLSAQYSQQLAPVMREALVNAGALPSSA